VTPLFDPGLQPERTELAWRRTALTIGVGSIVAIRLLPMGLGDPRWAACGVGGIVGAALLGNAASARYRAISRVLAAEGDHGFLPGAALLAVLGAFVFMLAGGSALLVLWAMLSK
jgi:uncharacterized membrane protein YidH (DUF202 family)